METSNRRKQNTISCLIILLSLLSLSQPQPDEPSNEKMNIGLILDMRSWLGKTIHICIKLAISDFYSVNGGYKTRMILHSRDSKGERSLALLSVHDLLNEVKVQAIIVQGIPLEGKLLALFSNKANIPFFSFTWNPSPVQYPYLFQIKQDESLMFKGIAALVESFTWRHVIVLYEDTIYGRETIPYLEKCFKDKNIVITCSSAISPSAIDDQIVQELRKVINSGTTTTVILHMSTFLASSILLNTKKLRIVNEKYTWIITDTAMDLSHTMDSEATESIGGTLALRPFIAASLELNNFTSRWKKEYDSKYPNTEARMSVLGVWAYDAIWALAECVEQVRSITASIDWKQDNGILMTGAVLVNAISKIRFKGLSGEFQLINGKLVPYALEIVKVRGSKEKRLGFWTFADGIKEDINANHWSVGSTNTPRKAMSLVIDHGKKLRVAVLVRTTFGELVREEYDLGKNTTTITGFCIEVFKAAIRALPHDLSYEFVPVSLPNGGYDELLHLVSLQKYDCAVADITILAYRFDWVDFTSPYTDLGVGTIARIDHKDNNMWIFFKPLGVAVWLTIAASFILMGFVVWLFEHPTNEVFQGTLPQQIGTVLWFSVMTLFFAQREPLSSYWSRFVVIIWLFVVLILTSCYTAILSSLLTVQQIQLASKGNIIGYHGGSFVEGVMVNNMNFSDYRLQPYKSIEEYAEALSRGSKNGGVDAIIDEIPYLKIFLAKYSARYAMIASDSTTGGFGFAFAKGSPLVKDVSREILKLREKGTLKMLEEQWFKSSQYLTSEDSATASPPKILNFGDLSGLFVIAAAAFGLAFLRYLYKFFQERYNLNRYVLTILAGGRLAIMMRYIYPRNLNGVIT